MKQVKTPINIMRGIISRFQIRDPLKTLFNPQFEAYYDFARDFGKITLIIQSPDAEGRRGVIPISISESLPMEIKHWERFPIEVVEDKGVRMLRKLLVTLINHEIDESVLFDNKLLSDPHPTKQKDITNALPPSPPHR